MTHFSSPISSRPAHGLTLAAGTLGLILAASPAYATQNQSGAGMTSGVASTVQESVHVVAPRPLANYDEIGAPIEDVSLSKAVSYRGLDLRTHSGAQTLRYRIRDTARDLCARLNFEYPVKTSDSPPCYRTAVKHAMHRANHVIREARYDPNIHKVHIE